MQLTAKVAQHSLQMKNVLVSAEDRTTTQVPLAKSSRHQHCLGESLCQGGTPVTRVVLEHFQLRNRIDGIIIARVRMR